MIISMQNEEELTYGEAIFQALYQEMALDEDVFAYGLGVDDPKGHYGTTKNLHEIYGTDRCFDMPLSEDAMTGIGIGAALNGMRPVYIHQRMDFLLLCMNQLINMASKYSYLSRGELSVPLVVRASIGRSWGQGAQHSQAFYSYFMHTPGIKVVAPTTPFDAKGTLISAIRDNNPVIFIEHRMLYANKGLVPLHSYEVELGKARILKEGSDITLVGISYTVVDCLRAAQQLEMNGISAEVIDCVSLAPLDYGTILKSAKKTKSIIVVDNGWAICGAGAEILAYISEHGYSNVSVKRMGYANTICPTPRSLEDAFYPSAEKISLESAKLLHHDDIVIKEMKYDEIEEFKGPF